jgi:hypothetical protein
MNCYLCGIIIEYQNDVQPTPFYAGKKPLCEVCFTDTKKHGYRTLAGYYSRHSKALLINGEVKPLSKLQEVK